MHTSFKIQYSARILGGLVFLVLFSLLQPMSNAIGSSQAVTRSAVMTIMGKTSDAVISSERHFLVSDSTVILDRNGKRIGLNDLAVPCTAQVKYQLRMDQSPLCLSIHLKKLHKVSRKDWSSRDHEKD
jgi:hypothetical protein